MIASFFQHLEEHEVRWLLISGQATILYGAATFSEDVDLWVDPGRENLARMKQALSASGASYYKLTPPMNADFAERHHGFHFTVPDDAGGVLLYLDVMACPPRVGPFREAWQRRSVFETEWGALNTVSIIDLVELKKTQRARDYPIISRLALAFLEHRGEDATEKDHLWAIANMFGLAEFTRLVSEYSRVVPEIEEDVLRRAAERLRDDELPVEIEDEIVDFFDAKMVPLRKADRRFWRTVIDELRQLRANGKLMRVGQPV